MSDPEMILMCEQNIRGGVSFVNECHVNLSHYDGEDEEKVQDHLLYMDANNLYSVAQADLVPVGNYSWLSEEELDGMEEEGEILSISATGPTGYILEVDLEYPQSLHAAHASMPLAPEKKEITYTDLSPYAQESLVHLRGENRAETYSAQKLCSTLKDKKCYVVHYRNLQTYLTLGLI